MLVLEEVDALTLWGIQKDWASEVSEASQKSRAERRHVQRELLKGSDKILTYGDGKMVQQWITPAVNPLQKVLVRWEMKCWHSEVHWLVGLAYLAEFQVNERLSQAKDEGAPEEEHSKSPSNFHTHMHEDTDMKAQSQNSSEL